MANPSGEHVEGLRELVRGLEKLGTEVQDLKDIFIPIGEMVAADARSMVPKRTGRLAASIKPTKTKNKAAVRVGSARVPYSGVIEWGWPRRGIKANPYLKPAVDGNKVRALEMMDEGLGKLLNRLGLA